MRAGKQMGTHRQIPYVNISGQHKELREELLVAIGSVLDEGQFVLGGAVEEFENRFAELCGVTNAVGLNSGTDSLVLALRVLGIGIGDEVITVPNSFVTTASSIRLVGARPVFVDVRPDLNMDPELVEGAITARTKAILPVHLTGRPADMGAIMRIADAHGLPVVEDCAQAVLAECAGRRVGSFGAVGCFSLHPLKTLNACGDGGVLTTNDQALADKVRTLRNNGLRTREDCEFWSSNSRLDTIQAAMLLIKLRYLNDWTERRREHAAYYCNGLEGVKQVYVPRECPNTRNVYHTFVIQAERRSELLEFLKARGVGTAIHYPVPIHLMTAAKELGYPAGSFPVTETLAHQILSLPIYPELSEADLHFVVDSIRQFYRT
jgi:dTDP-4-amino-4,6-dideoxygalactose transaminase